MNQRWVWVAWSVVACGAGPLEWDAASQTESTLKTSRLRVVAANLTSGDHQSYDPGPGARILHSLDADLILLQEFNAADVSGFVNATFGPEFSFVRGGLTEQIPNGVVSRFPLVQSGTWADPLVNGTRGFTWALVDVPGPVEVFAVSLHLSTTRPDARDAEAKALMAKVSQTQPTGAVLVLGGDLNTSTRNEPALATLSRMVGTAPPYPVDGAGNENTNATRTRPYDWVLVSPRLAANERPVVLDRQTFKHGAVIDTRQQTLPGTQPSDSGAPNMQHMAVVREFALPR